MADVYPVAADTIGTFFIGVSPFYVSLDTSPEKHIDAAATFCPYISSCSPYFVSGNWIWCGFQLWQYDNLLCGYSSKSPWVGYQVSKNMTLPYDCRQATNSLSVLVIVIAFFWSYVLSCTHTPKYWHWFGLMRVCSISFIYNAQLKTSM